MRKPSQEKLDINQNLAIMKKPDISNKDFLQFLNDKNLLLLVKKALDQQSDNKESNLKAETQKKQNENKPSVKNLSQKDPDSLLQGLQNSALMQKFMNSKKGVELKAKIAKYQAETDDMIKKMLLESFKKELLKAMQRMAKRYQMKKKREEAADKLLKYAYQSLEIAQKKREADKKHLTTIPELESMPEYKSIMTHYNREMNVLLAEHQSLVAEIAEITGQMQRAQLNYQASLRAVRTTESFIDQIAELPREDQIILLAQKKEQIESLVNSQTETAETSLQEGSHNIPARIQRMHLQLRCLNQALMDKAEDRILFNKDGQVVSTRAEAQYTLPKTQKLVKHNDQCYLIGAHEEFHSLDEQSRTQANQSFIQLAPKMQLTMSLTRQNRDEEHNAFSRKLESCRVKLDACIQKQESAKVSCDAALNDLVTQNPHLSVAPKPVPVQVSTTKPTKVTPAPKPTVSSSDKFKEKYNLFKNQSSFTKQQLLDYFDKELSSPQNDQSKNYLNQALIHLRPGDRVPQQLVEELQRKLNQEQSTPSPLMMSPRPVPR